MKHRYTGTYAGSTLCPREEGKQSTRLHKGAHRCSWWGWACEKGAEGNCASGWPASCLWETRGIRTWCSPQKQRDQPCHIHARGKTLVAAFQLKQSFQKATVKTEYSDQVSGLLETFDSYQVSWPLFCKGRLTTENGVFSLSWLQGFIALFPFFFFYLLLMKGAVEILRQKAEKGYEGNIELSWIWTERCFTKRCELLQQSNFSSLASIPGGKWRNAAGEEAARHPWVDRVSPSRTAHGSKTKWSKVPSRPWALYACADQP